MRWKYSDILKLSDGCKVIIPEISKSRVNIPAQDCEQVNWMHYNLQYFCNERAMELIKEYRFHSVRLWRLDFYIPALKVGIEYEGIFSDKSRHTTFKGYSADTDKYREAAKLGIMVLRYTSKNYKQVLDDLREIIKNN